MSGSIRLFVSDPLAAGAAITATPVQAQYLSTVMRRDAGDAVRLFNGRDGEWQARIVSIRRDRGKLLVEELLRPQCAEPDIWLVFALLKRDATDLVVQKATELGVSLLLPVFTARTVPDRMNQTRLAAIATEAAEQSERLTVPAVEAARRLTEVLECWPSDRILHAAIERIGAPPLCGSGAAANALLVGPEGGFSESEVRLLRGCHFVVPVSLGPFVLRAETAAIAGLALLQAPTTL
jgi:16S rRNA (uracil1498-N3)-methyltransferase